MVIAVVIAAAGIHSTNDICTSTFPNGHFETTTGWETQLFFVPHMGCKFTTAVEMVYVRAWGAWLVTQSIRLCCV